MFFVSSAINTVMITWNRTYVIDLLDKEQTVPYTHV